VLKDQIDEVSYTPNGRRLAVVDWDGNVAMFDADTLRPVGHQFHLPKTLGWELSAGPDNHTVFVTGSAPRNYAAGWQDPVHRWWLVDLAHGKVLKQGRLDVEGGYTAFSPRGDRVAVGGRSGSVEVLDLRTGQPVRRPVVVHAGGVIWVTFNRDGSRIASGGYGDVALWNGLTGQLLNSAKIPGVEHPVFPGFRPDGTLTVASFGGQAYHWDPSPGHTIAFACHAAGRDMTRAEWAEALPGRAYRPVCPSGT
jgi:WD40 repeat protein